MHRIEDIIIAATVLNKIGQPMLSDDPSNKEYYIEIKEAIDNAHKFSYSGQTLNRGFDVDKNIIILERMICTYIIFSCI